MFSEKLWDLWSQIFSPLTSTERIELKLKYVQQILNLRPIGLYPLFIFLFWYKMQISKEYLFSQFVSWSLLIGTGWRASIYSNSDSKE